MSNTLPLEKQSKRVHSGLLPDYYHRIDVAYPSDTVEVYTYWQYDFKLDVNKVCAILTVTYTDNTKEFIASVENPLARGAP